jgi:hypothetical protein
MSDSKNDHTNGQNPTASQSQNLGAQNLGPQNLGPQNLGPNVTPLLTAALRRARIEEAEHSEVITDLRAAELARLEMLRDSLRPLLAQVPAHIDMFDIGLMPSEQPRLFIDMIAYVEMARDRRSYRFVQDTRHGAITIAESELIEPMCEAIAAYMARRLIERERALISDQTVEDAAHRLIKQQALTNASTNASTNAALPADQTRAAPATTAGRHWLWALCSFIITATGTVFVLSLLALGAFVAWTLFAPMLLNFLTPDRF